jgi:molecular chaperone GrpE
MPSSRGIDAHDQRDPPRQERRETDDMPAAQDDLDGAGQSEFDQRDLKAELARIEDLYKRALADLDNYRKRSAREIEQQVSRARDALLRECRTAEVKESMLIDWLEAVDSVERAIQMEQDGPCRDGLRAVMGQMDAVLQRQGAQRIGAPGEPFDPERHEALAVRASHDAPDRTILEVQRSGFALGERVVRPAQVVVARASEHAR